jgi:hypothetical protein
MTATRLESEAARPVTIVSMYEVEPAVDAAAVELARTQHGVISADQLIEIGVPETTVAVRARPGGEYARVLPGVFRLGSASGCGAGRGAGQVAAALLYAGAAQAVVTGMAALHLYGVPSVDRIAAQFGDQIDIRLHVLVPHDVRRDSHGFVRIERTRYIPKTNTVRGIPVSPVARAIIDAGRTIGDVSLLRPLISEAMNGGLVTSAELLDVAATMPVRGSVAIRQVVDEVSLGVASQAIADLRDAILRADLRLPHFLPTILDRRGCFLARVHGYRAPEGVAFLLTDDPCSVAVAGATTRLVDLRRTGVLVLEATSAELRADPIGSLAAYAAALAESAGRPAPDLRILRAPGGIGRSVAGVI